MDPQAMLSTVYSAMLAPDSVPSVYGPLVGSVLYLATVFTLKKVCTVRRDLTAIAVVHNSILIALSVSMATGGIYALATRYMQEGFDGIFCSQRPAGTVLDGPAGLWLRVFYWSKFVELIDTVLLCMKLKPTIPLHIYHHVSMLWLCWSWVRFEWLEGSLWCVIVNSIIHTFMYYYYLVSALGKDVWWKKYLTMGQIIQFLTGTAYVSVYLWNDYMRGDVAKGGCGAFERRYCAWAAHGVNITFIMLFAQFFGKTYKKKPKDPKAASAKAQPKAAASTKDATAVKSAASSDKPGARKRASTPTPRSSDDKIAGA
eukprot:gnl/TRDRNA2_/TRDRNA2_181526_c0_seq1.p1 gnl/TRDRNA2_/TRDRNA2_181526_c0~~gnl/TRDRNA2_/TRDRNA2_181526_c0_seq1.p1  ORF type:complete len:314 (-),score=64.42 gnl/TRDRNA2_/TRDRNA2_181526_c0_seq1:298-1239(-)